MDFQLWVLARPAEYLNFILTYNQYSLTWVKDYTTFQVNSNALNTRRHTKTETESDKQRDKSQISPSRDPSSSRLLLPLCLIEIWMKDVDLKTLADQMHLEFELMSAKFIAASI
eukprot:368226-Amorphochlora_amoeboformis.AAC.1